MICRFHVNLPGCTEKTPKKPLQHFTISISTPPICGFTCPFIFELAFNLLDKMKSHLKCMQPMDLPLAFFSSSTQLVTLLGQWPGRNKGTPIVVIISILQLFTKHTWGDIGLKASIRQNGNGTRSLTHTAPIQTK